MGFFDDVNSYTTDNYGSYLGQVQPTMPEMNLNTNDKLTSSAPIGTDSSIQMQPEAGKAGEGTDSIGKASGALKSIGSLFSSGQKHAGGGAPQVSMQAPNFNALAGASQPQMGMAPMQMPQMAAPITPMQIPQMPMAQPNFMAPMQLGQAMSDYRTKTNIKSASEKIDALLNKVYQNVVTRSQNRK